MNSAERQRFLGKRLEIFRDKFYADGIYHYNERYMEMMKTITGSNKGIQFHVFTTPVSRLLFEQMVRQGRYHDYERWLREIVRVFGSVYNFMTINSVTSEMNNYYDADHFYPSVGTLVSKRLCGALNPASQADFGDFVTGENIESYLQHLRQQVEARYGHEALQPRRDDKRSRESK
jgi:hypothetical protein